MVRPAEFAYHLFWQSLDWIYPPKCGGCGEPGKTWCDACQKSILKISGKICDLCGYPIRDNQVCQGCNKYDPHFDAIRSWAVYSGSVKEAIHSLKYQNNLSLGEVFSHSLAGLVKKAGWKVDAVIPVPLSKARMKQRGYNQAWLLGYPVALQLQVPIDTSSVQRTKNTESQVHLNPEERAVNLKDAFGSTKMRWKDKNVLLIDDVITTGSTINECARALKFSGVKEVYGVSVARAVLGDMST